MRNTVLQTEYLSDDFSFCLTERVPTQIDESPLDVFRCDGLDSRFFSSSVYWLFVLHNRRFLLLCQFRLQLQCLYVAERPICIYEDFEVSLFVCRHCWLLWLWLLHRFDGSRLRDRSCN